jgi:hypothetical protein
VSREATRLPLKSARRVLLASVVLFGTLASAVSSHGAQIDSMSPDHGITGNSITLSGSGLSFAIRVRFSGIDCLGAGALQQATFRIVDDFTIIVQVPLGVITGPITVDLNLRGSISSPVFKVPVPNDFNGDGYSDLLWRDPDNGVGYWAIQRRQLIGSAPLGSVPADMQFVRTGDFNGDGRADILWRDSSGGYGVWFIDTLAIIAAGPLPAVPAGMTFAGIADFDRDGIDDIVWRDADGGIGVWLMNGLTIKSGAPIGSAPVATALAGISDVDGDGFPDFVWMDAFRVVGAWLLDGMVIRAGANYGNAPVGRGLFGVADVTGDGAADIIWSQPAPELSGFWASIGGTSMSALNGWLFRPMLTLGKYDPNSPTQGMYRSGFNLVTTQTAGLCTTGPVLQPDGRTAIYPNGYTLLR